MLASSKHFKRNFRIKVKTKLKSSVSFSLKKCLNSHIIITGNFNAILIVYYCNVSCISQNMNNTRRDKNTQIDTLVAETKSRTHGVMM